MKTLGIIPARYASSRFPGKALANIAGKSMLQRVYEQAQQAKLLDAVVVATDDERIFDHCNAFHGNVMMTSPDHQSGTDRCAEVARQVEDFELVVNIQGDEPFIQPEQIDLVVEPLKKDAQISTLAKQIESSEALFNPNVVKVVFDNHHRAMYFSRHPVPYVRGELQTNWLKAPSHFKHIGLYGFRRDVLLAISELPIGFYEKCESLEQLRWLEQGYTITVALTDKETIGIDTPDDLAKIKL